MSSLSKLRNRKHVYWVQKQAAQTVYTGQDRIYLKSNGKTERTLRYSIKIVLEKSREKEATTFDYQVSI